MASRVLDGLAMVDMVCSIIGVRTGRKPHSSCFFSPIPLFLAAGAILLGKPSPPFLCSSPQQHGLLTTFMAARPIWSGFMPQLETLRFGVLFCKTTSWYRVVVVVTSHNVAPVTPHIPVLATYFNSTSLGFFSQRAAMAIWLVNGLRGLFSVLGCLMLATLLYSISTDGLLSAETFSPRMCTLSYPLYVYDFYYKECEKLLRVV
ncbi:hypothetical protein CK203_081629 [Vitis vinifera]|uniref:Uncharacterized protein n=1 Tax=Vitis vinifera TaxID=29760 RepID=A0A438DPL0_VITVI|nr:hypothetical protein CK203_081629 [Vitis vinifera]